MVRFLPFKHALTFSNLVPSGTLRCISNYPVLIKANLHDSLRVSLLLAFAYNGILHDLVRHGRCTPGDDNVVLMKVDIERIFEDVGDVDGCRSVRAIVGLLDLQPGRKPSQPLVSQNDPKSTHFGLVSLRFKRGTPPEEIVRREDI